MSCNVILEYVEFNKKCQLKYLKYLLNGRYNKEILIKFLDIYGQVRYYNLLESKQKSLVANINYYLRQVSNELIQQYGSDVEMEGLIKDTLYFFKYLMYFDELKKVDSIDIVFAELKSDFLNKVDKVDSSFFDTLKYMVVDDRKRLNNFLSKLDSNVFSLSIDKTNEVFVFDISIRYDLKIPRLYSQYAIDKVFNSDIISEDMIFVVYYMINKKLIDNIVVGDFNKLYLVDFCVSLFEKKDKLKRLFNIIDNDIARDRISIKILYRDFINYQTEFYDFMRRGYKFSVILTNDDELDDFEFQKLGVFEYVLDYGCLDKKLLRLDNVIVSR